MITDREKANAAVENVNIDSERRVPPFETSQVKYLYFLAGHLQSCKY